MAHSVEEASASEPGANDAHSVSAPPESPDPLSCISRPGERPCRRFGLPATHVSPPDPTLTWHRRSLANSPKPDLRHHLFQVPPSLQTPAVKRRRQTEETIRFDTA